MHVQDDFVAERLMLKWVQRHLNAAVSGVRSGTGLYSSEVPETQSGGGNSKPLAREESSVSALSTYGRYSTTARSTLGLYHNRIPSASLWRIAQSALQMR